MAKVIKVIIYITIVSILLAGTSYYFANDIYHSTVAEDGYSENVTAITLLTISVLFLIRIIKTRKKRNNWWLVLNILIVLGSFFGFGEEISWGQRIFSIETGEFFAQHNLQNETNLHNLQIGDVKVNKLIFSQGMVIVFGFYFVLSLIFYKKFNFFTKMVDLFGIQIPKLTHSVIMLACTGMIMLIPDLRKWELWEAVFVLLLLLVFLDPYNTKEKLLPSKSNELKS